MSSGWRGGRPEECEWGGREDCNGWGGEDREDGQGRSTRLLHLQGAIMIWGGECCVKNHLHPTFLYLLCTPGLSLGNSKCTEVLHQLLGVKLSSRHSPEILLSWSASALLILAINDNYFLYFISSNPCCSTSFNIYLHDLNPCSLLLLTWKYMQL